MSGVLTLAPRLALGRIRGARGGGVLEVMAVLAFTVSSFLALTVTGGAWMLYQRWRHPDGGILGGLGMGPAAVEGTLENYVILVVGACALLAIPVLNLGAAAARLGARGRASRLASLRLVGMTGREVLVMSVLETLVQAAAGVLFGAGLWLLSLPAWQAVSLQGQEIAPAELILPWWLALVLTAVLLGLAAMSTAMGLRQVRISPLGVAMQQTPRGVRAWRLLAFVLALVAFVVLSRFFNPGTLDLLPYLLLSVMVLIVVGSVNLVGPWVIQLLARFGTRTASVPRLIAMRRIIDDPRAAWRNVSAIALLGLVAAYLSVLPTESEALGASPASVLIITDLRTGAVITLSVGLLLAATSTLVNQAALVVDRAGESITMDRMGVPRSVFAATSRHHVLTPLLMTLTISIGVGLVLATPFMSEFGINAPGVALIGVTAALGLALMSVVTEACRPLQRRILDNAARHND
ncbi:hypothetical protein [Dietzia sp. PP-33]|jgi:hypothetical protein|uniref:hypothetical protein n=1 Tax=Dietzia sp. PP-33 TaxID=2957500 RepID=UPI0029AB7DF1|nr:hypothetical protein [Dietzia sp. PP-33]MDX2356577.1 hypothetical protein [Dietzia sp. PP-33]